MGMSQPMSVRPQIANAVANPMARPACCAPSAGTSKEKRCAVKPICANSPKAIPAESVRNFQSPQSRDPGSDRAAGDARQAVGPHGPSSSGVNPICCGVRDSTEPARTHMVSAAATPIAAAAIGNPKRPIAATQSGEKITPPMLPPL
jgi:hypothetical protein